MKTDVPVEGVELTLVTCGGRRRVLLVDSNMPVDDVFVMVTEVTGVPVDAYELLTLGKRLECKGSPTLADYGEVKELHQILRHPAFIQTYTSADIVRRLAAVGHYTMTREQMQNFGEGCKI